MKKAIALLLLAALAVTACIYVLAFGQSLHFVVDVSVHSQGGVALVDHTDDQSRIVRMDLTGAIDFIVQDSKIQGDSFLKRPEIVTLADGSVLVKESLVNYEDYTVSYEQIVRYSGASEKEILFHYNSPWDTEERISGLYALNGEIGCFGMGNSQLVRYTLSQQGEIGAVEEAINLPFDMRVSQAIQTNRGVAVLLTTNEIYMHEAEGKFTRIYPMEGESAIIAQMDTDEAGNLLIRDENIGALLAVDEKGNISTWQDTGRRFTGQGVMIRDLLRMDSANAALFAGIYTDASTLCIVQGDTSVKITPHRPMSYTLGTGALIFAGCFTILLLGFLFVRQWLSKDRIFPLVAKNIAIGLPMILAGAGVLYMLASTAIGTTLTGQYYNTLFDAGQRTAGQIRGSWLAQLDLNEPYSDSSYTYIKEQTMASPPYQMTVISPQGERVAQSFYYHWLFAVREGKIYSAICEDNQIGMPIRYIYDQDVSASYERVIIDKKPVFCQITDNSGDWMLTLTPIYENPDGSGEIVGVLETGSNSASAQGSIRYYAYSLALAGSGLMLVIMLSLLVILTLSLRPLRRLKSTMQSVADGQYGLQVTTRSHDEIAHLSRIFNVLSQTVLRQFQNMSTLNAAYYRFVPLKMMELLGGKGAQDVDLGDQTLLTMTVMQLTVHDFDALVTSTSTQDLFTLLNEIYETFVPLLGRYGGVIDRYTQAGWISLFTGGPYDAIAASADIMARLAEYNEVRLARGERPIHLGVAIATGPVMVGIVGQKDRVSAMAISEVVNMTQYLLDVGRSFGSRIIFADTRTEVETLDFSTRWLGHLAVAGREERIDLFDCYDGDSRIQRTRKRDTAQDFALGVAAYTQGEYYRARKAFVDVLRVNPSDAAATAYLVRCDEEYRLENPHKQGGAMFVFS